MFNQLKISGYLTFIFSTFLISLSGQDLQVDRQSFRIERNENISSKRTQNPNFVSTNGSLAIVDPNCQDTVQYPLAKATGLNPLSINNASSAKAVCQYFDAPQDIMVHGFEFYAYKTDATGGITMTINCHLYLAGPDSLPTGSPLASTSVLMDTSFGGGTLTGLLKTAIFPNPVTVSVPYVLVFENNSSINCALVHNDWSTGNGQMEWLASADLFGTWIRGYGLNIGGSPFDADALLHPIVSYHLEANFDKDPSSFADTATVTFTNLSSPIFFNRMYNQAAYLDLQERSFTWDFGDGTTVNAVDTFNFYNPGFYQVKLVDTMFGWRNVCAVDTCMDLGCLPELKEDAQSEIVSPSYINLDCDGLTDANGRPMNWYVDVDQQSTTPGDTNYVLASSSWFNAPGQADNWLILPAICIENADYKAQWKSAPFEGPAYADGYVVLVSTTGTDKEDFTDTLAHFAEDISNGSGVWGEGIQHTLFNGSFGVLNNWIFSLSEYAGKSIHLAFVHNSNDDNQIKIDDICIQSNDIIDAALTDVNFPSEYTIIPLNQIRACPLNLGCEVSCLGDTITNVSACCNIYRDEMLITTVYSNVVPSMNPNSDPENLIFNEPFVPVASGEYIFEYVVKIAELDTFNNNDTITTSFTVSETTMARDNGLINTFVSIGNTTTGILGMNYTLKSPDTLVGLDIFFNSVKLDDSLKLVVYNSVGPYGQPTTLIDETDWMVLDDSYASKLNRFYFDTPIGLSEGSYYVGYVESKSSTMTVGLCNDIFTPSTAWIYFNGLWRTSESFNFDNAYVIRPFFQECRDSLYLSAVIPGSEMNINYQASWNISSTDTIESGAMNIYYDSGGTIDLLPGFLVELGVNWGTLLSGCGPMMSLKSDVEPPSKPTNHSILDFENVKKAPLVSKTKLRSIKDD